MKKVYIIPILIIVGLGIWFVSNRANNQQVNRLLSETEARIIAEKSCIKGGEVLANGSYNENSKTWWYDANLNATLPGCNPVCVVNEETKTAEINWRCAGLKEPKACTEEAKLCPDGSAVGRTGPNCEFAQCPNTSISGQGTVQGKVTLSPTCPVERIPPDPNCAPKPYTTSINILKVGSTRIIKTIQSDINGAFSASFDAGAYTLQAGGSKILPKCADVSVEVINGQTITADISCDTGIR